MLTPIQIVNVAAVCILWGCTNPFLRRGSMETSTTTTTTTTTTKNDNVSSSPTSICRWFLSLWSKWQFLLPFALNQAGSACYAVLLGQIDLMLALPLCNSLAFVLTALTGYLLGEKISSPWLLSLGTILVLSGTAICAMSQTW